MGWALKDRVTQGQGVTDWERGEDWPSGVGTAAGPGQRVTDWEPGEDWPSGVGTTAGLRSREGLIGNLGKTGPAGRGRLERLAGRGGS